ncbi:MAG: hypothetical protein ISR84_06720 [Kiritimatiellales bacterium]|nr:hypothetical protein [Kiritimatiellales bacterium]
MRRSVAHLILATCLLTGLVASPAWADIGLLQIFSTQGLTQVGLAVKAAVEGIYGSTEDPEEISSQITAILDEAALTGNPDIVSYTIVAVILAGGLDNLDLSKEAVDNSKAFTDFPTITAFTVSAAEGILSADSDSLPDGGGGKDSGGGGEDGGGEEGGGKTDEELGGGDGENPLDDGGDADIRDDDIPGTPV